MAKTKQRTLAFFLRQLERTGNITLAAECAGLAKSGIHKRKRRDPIFRQQCEVAIAAFRNQSPSPWMGEGRGEGDLRRGLTRTVSGALIPSRYAGIPQLRRLPSDRLTARGKAMFLAAIANTGNIRLAAREIGIAASSIHWRRRTDPAFAEQLEAALDIAVANIECALIRAADRTFDGDWTEGVDPDGPKMTIGQMIWLLQTFQRSGC